MPAKSSTLSESLKNDKVKQTKGGIVKKTSTKIPIPITSSEVVTSEVDPIVLYKRKLRAMNAREHAIVWFATNVAKGNILPETCDECLESVCDCKQCEDCGDKCCEDCLYNCSDFPTIENKCLKCHPNFSDYETDYLEEIEKGLSKKYDKSPFDDSDDEQDELDIDPDDCDVYEEGADSE